VDRGARNVQSITACWTRRWPAWSPRRCRRRSRDASPVEPQKSGSPSTRPLYPRPDAWCSPGPGARCTTAACRCRGSSKTAARAGSTSSNPPRNRAHLRTGPGPRSPTWRGPRPAHPHGQDRSRQVKESAGAACTPAGPRPEAAARLFVLDAGYSAAALTDGLAGCPAPRPGPARPPAACSYAEPATLGGQVTARPGRPRAPPCNCLGAPRTSPLPTLQEAPPGGRKKPPASENPEPERDLTLPDKPPLRHPSRPAEAWHDVHHSSHGDAGCAGEGKKTAVLARHPGPCPTVEPPCPTGPATRTGAHVAVGHARAPAPCPSTSSGGLPPARDSDIETRLQAPQGQPPRAHPPRSSVAPEHGRPLAPAPRCRATPSFLLARPLAADLRRPREKNTPTPPGRGTGAGSAAGYSQHPPRPGDSRPVSAKPSAPGPAGPKGNSKKAQPTPPPSPRPKADMPRNSESGADQGKG